MAVKPDQSPILITNGASSAVLYCSDIEISTVSTLFTRSEFLHAKLKTAPENTGTEPQIGTLLYGVPYNIVSTGAVVPSTTRNLQPDDSALTSIYQKFFIIRYTIKGTTTKNSDASQVYYWSELHRILQDRFDAHQQYAQGNVSVQELVTLQAENFSYLTTTGIGVTSAQVGNLSNMLIRSFQMGVDYYVESSGLVLNDFTLTLDSILIQAASP